MCGIVAVLTPDKSFPLSILMAMRDRMIHRGPDGASEWLERMEEGTIAMGHRRLSIIDLSTAGQQPMFSQDERYVLIFNGEIYNYIELRETLISKGYKFRSESDSEVLLTAFIEWGEECLTKLNGMFAFCIWDRIKKELFCARDRFGEKPFYLTKIKGGGIAISSEIKALFAHPNIKASPSDVEIASFLQGSTSYSKPETFFENIQRLPASHAVIFNTYGEEVRRWRYWTPDYNVRNSKKKESDIIEEFKDRFLKSLKMRLRSDVKVGACLSGGLDSSTIVGMLNFLKSNGIELNTNTYSARFDHDPTISEGIFIDDMIAHTGFHAESVTPRAENFIEESERIHWHQEQPFLSASMYLEWCVVRKARETGTTVLLDGQGADEVLGGYEYHFKDILKDQLLKGQLLSYTNNKTLFKDRILEEITKYKDSERRINLKNGLEENIPQKALKEFIKQFTQPEHYVDNRVGIPRSILPNFFRNNLAKGLLYDTLPSNLHSADCNGMAHSLETRFPYLDYELVDWCIGLPDNMMIKDGWLKYILRQIGKDVVPDTIRWRVDKVGFAAPQDTWLRSTMKQWGWEKLFDGPISKQPGYDRYFLENIWEEHQNGIADKSWDLWRYISLNEWLTLHENGTWTNGLAPQITKSHSGALL